MMENRCPNHAFLLVNLILLVIIAVACSAFPNPTLNVQEKTATTQMVQIASSSTITKSIPPTSTFPPVPSTTPTPVSTSTNFPTWYPDQFNVGSTAVFSKGAPYSIDTAATAALDLPPLGIVDLSIWFSPACPLALRSYLEGQPGIQFSDQPAGSDVLVEAHPWSGPSPDALSVTRWVYALVAPFPTPLDEVSMLELRNAWAGKTSYYFGDTPLRMAESTRQAFSVIWGQPAVGAVQVVESAGELVDQTWSEQPAWAIIPFEDLEPRWKVLKVEGISPYDPDFNPDAYPLTLGFAVLQNPEAVVLPAAVDALRSLIPASNYDPTRRTLLTMTGTTALVRMTAVRMEENGVEYPARDIQSWLADSDLTHVSNEVAFTPDCPPAVPVRKELRFCSSPKYFNLFTFAGVDFIELTGNHLTDYGLDALNFTLDLYQSQGMPYYGGGRDLTDAQSSLFAVHNGNRFVFLGCNAVGPPDVFAAKDRPGANPCDLDELEKQVIAYRAAGFQPIVTFQHFEFSQFIGYAPQSAQRVDFQRIARAGAVIVSGSQAHYPQTMTILNGSFIHYGLGNLFFDQMEEPSRWVFIDRHIFYNGRYIGTELLTAQLEDYARLRPLRVSERRKFLTKVFESCVWN